LRAEAVRASNRVKSEGYRAADKLVEDAKNPIAKAAAKIAADKMRKETDKRAQQVIDEADEQAKGIMSKAQKQADDLLK